jgi:hypothetical protein
MVAFGGLSQVATTGPAGFALQDATPTIFSWIAPNDGNLHAVALYSEKYVASTETGGAIGLTFTIGGQTGTVTPFGGGGAEGIRPNGTAGALNIVVDPGSTVTLAQASALTGGTSTLYALLFAR